MKGAFQNEPHRAIDANARGDSLNEAGSFPGNLEDGLQAVRKVGVATGETFVGNLRAADRIIWSAIGNTTNLAARLQSLTRPLKAAMGIDRTTWQAAGTRAADFQLHERVTTRGRKKREDVYVMSATSRDRFKNHRSAATER